MSPLTEAQKKARWREKKRVAADPVRAFLTAVLDRGQTDAASIRATQTAGDLLDRLNAPETNDHPLAKYAAAVGMTGRGTIVYTQGEERQREALTLIRTRIVDGTATPADTRAGLLVAARAIRSGRPTFDDRAVSIRLAMVLSGASQGRAGISPDLLIDDGRPDDPAVRDPREPADLR